jgi:hypothetical protein
VAFSRGGAVCLVRDTLLAVTPTGLAMEPEHQFEGCSSLLDDFERPRLAYELRDSVERIRSTRYGKCF